MDGIRIYARDLAAEIRRVPSVLMIALALLLLAMSASSEVVADARVVVVSELHDVWLVAKSGGSGGQDVKRLKWGVSDLSMDDLEME